MPDPPRSAYPPEHSLRSAQPPATQLGYNCAGEPPAAGAAGAAAASWWTGGGGGGGGGGAGTTAGVGGAGVGSGTGAGGVATAAVARSRRLLVRVRRRVRDRNRADRMGIVGGRHRDPVKRGVGRCGWGRGCGGGGLSGLTFGGGFCLGGGGGGSFFLGLGFCGIGGLTILISCGFKSARFAALPNRSLLETQASQPKVTHDRGQDGVAEDAVLQGLLSCQRLGICQRSGRGSACDGREFRVVEFRS